MSSTYLTFLVTHGNLGKCLKSVSEKLIVPSTELIYYSNEEYTLEELENKISGKIDSAKPDKVIIFVDLFGGSCWLLANRIKRTSDQIKVLAGANVPMLISYFINYNRLPWDELIEKLVTDGRKGIISR